jgi:hypothetical protein
VPKRIVCLFLIVLAAGGMLAADNFALGINSSLHLQYSANTYRFSPGLGVSLTVTVEPLEFDARFYLGTLFGYSLFAGLECYYIIPLDQWKPRIGISVNVDFGGYFFHTQSPDFIAPIRPEAGIGISMKPYVSIVGDFTISLGRILIGTDFQYFGRVLVFEIELFGLAYRF